MESRLGASLREMQEIAQLDRNEASARLKMAAAEVKEKEAELRGNTSASDVVRSQLEAAQARAELAQLALDRCTLRAPFAGRLVALPVCAGQYVVKGTVIAELADVTALKTLVPVDRRSVSSGAALTVQVEGQDVSVKVMAVLPLVDRFFPLRELATPFASAWVTVPNPKEELEPGLRVRTATIPTTPIATVARRAVKHDAGAGSDVGMVQVIRNEYVTNVPVRVLGDTGTDRTQITGPFRVSDALIVSSSVSLLAGTLLRFGDGAAANRGIEGLPPNPAYGGVEAGLTQPGGATTRGTTARAPRTGSAPTKPAAPASSPSTVPY
jgi:multidrug efflux pump subunit AcrA (membrane-fusion protein)